MGNNMNNGEFTTVHWEKQRWPRPKWSGGVQHKTIPKILSKTL
jgi:hypothetical protein